MKAPQVAEQLRFDSIIGAQREREFSTGLSQTFGMLINYFAQGAELKLWLARLTQSSLLGLSWPGPVFVYRIYENAKKGVLFMRLLID